MLFSHLQSCHELLCNTWWEQWYMTQGNLRHILDKYSASSGLLIQMVQHGLHDQEAKLSVVTKSVSTRIKFGRWYEEHLPAKFVISFQWNVDSEINVNLFMNNIIEVKKNFVRFTPFPTGQTWLDPLGPCYQTIQAQLIWWWSMCQSSPLSAQDCILSHGGNL